MTEMNNTMTEMVDTEMINREMIGAGMVNTGIDNTEMTDSREQERIDREEADREEIVRDLDSNIFVEAGAGAGKTSILVRRILNQLRTGRAKAEELAAITFTNKAAQELKIRIGDAVRRSLHEAEPGSDAHRNLKEALYDLDRMQISTIHSFCYRLLMEQTFLASMRMDMEMIEDEDAAAEKSEFFQAWYKKLDYAVIRHVRDNFAGKRVAEVLRQAFCDVCELPDETEIFYDHKLLDKSLQDFLEEAAAQKERLAGIILDDLNREAGTHLDSLVLAAEEGYFLAEFKKAVLEKRSNIEFLKKVSNGIRIFKSGKPSGMKKAACDELTNACLERFFQGFDLDAYDRSFCAYQNALIMDFIMPARAEYRKHHENRHITNDTLLEKARNLVTGHPEARAFFQRKFKCIYVDEFQDTDHVQTDLIFSLCSDEKGGLKAGSLFVVGDPKQSIYRFRGADLPLYFSVKKKMAGMKGCRLFNLNYNYRSGEDVINYVNDNNAEVLQGYQPMISMSDEPADHRPDRQISGVYINWDPEVPLEDQEQRDDTFYVVSTIRGLVDSKVLVWDKEKKCHRPVCYKDFLVLCYSTNKMEDYLAAMLANEIPVQISGKVDMSNVRELHRFANIYRYLAYPQYAKAREGALQTVLEENVNDENFQTGMERLDRIREEVKGMDGISMALYLLRHLEYVLDWDVKNEKYYLLRIQAQIQQMIETVCVDTVNHPQALSDGFMEYLSGTVDRELSLSAESDAVRFMNIHKAKGLEGRIVIICKRSEDFSARESSFQVKKDGENGYLYYHTVAEKTSEFSANYYPAYVHDDEIREKAEEEELAEYRRLEYVEATRGMEALIFMMPLLPKKSKKERQYSFKGYSFEGCRQIDLEFPDFYEYPVEDPDMLPETEEQETGAQETAEQETRASETVEQETGTQETAEADTAQSEESPCEEYDFDRWSPDFSDDRFFEGYLTLTPSSLEMKVNVAGKEEEEGNGEEAIERTEEAEEIEGKESGTGDESAAEAFAEADNKKRPTGNIFGTIMHRGLELLVKEIRVKADPVIDKSSVNTAVLQALMESGDELEDAFGTAYNAKAKEYRDFLTKILEEFAGNEQLVNEIRQAPEVYTEFPFSFFTSGKEDSEMFAALRGKVSAGKAEKLLPSDPRQRVWINGKADLVIIRPDGTVRILDYKSDINNGLSGSDFADIINRRYGGQMELYRYVCAKLFNTPVEKITGEFYLI